MLERQARLWAPYHDATCVALASLALFALPVAELVARAVGSSPCTTHGAGHRDVVQHQR